jgi:hypothetical protein
MVYQTVLHHVTGHAVFAIFVIERSAIGVIVVVTLAVLFHVLRSNTLHVIVPVFVIVPFVAITVHEMTTLHTQPLRTLPILRVKIFHEKVPVDAVNHVNPTGNVSEMITPMAVAGQGFV